MTRDTRDDSAAQEYERGEAVLSIFKRGAEFTRQLLSENEMLRNRLQELNDRQRSAAQDPDQWEKLRQELKNRISTLEVENQTILSQLHEIENENHQFAERYIEIEEENNNLANLYVASYQLHSTLDASEVLKVILEIVINLVGAEIFSVYVYDDKKNYLEPVASEGRPLSSFPRIEVGNGFVGESVAAGEVATQELASPDGETPVVCIPLQVDERPVGAIVINSLLQQKSGFSPLDHELFTLLAGHAATAIFASRLHSQSKRKLSTIQGFIDLLSK
ncbi:MAG: GAF domain-containing protein [Deltaproteobacteria bacterium]|nr:GAF domain-containing protein [Deltaproteobacteria bacterium]